MNYYPELLGKNDRIRVILKTIASCTLEFSSVLAIEPFVLECESLSWKMTRAYQKYLKQADHDEGKRFSLR